MLRDGKSKHALRVTSLPRSTAHHHWPDHNQDKEDDNGDENDNDYDDENHTYSDPDIEDVTDDTESSVTDSTDSVVIVDDSNEFDDATALASECISDDAFALECVSETLHQLKIDLRHEFDVTGALAILHDS